MVGAEPQDVGHETSDGVEKATSAHVIATSHWREHEQRWQRWQDGENPVTSPPFLGCSAGAAREKASCSAALVMSAIAHLLIALVRTYQITLSPFLGKVCRFEPSCSRYTVACLAAHGAMRGSLLSVKRLCKCHPFHPGGLDPPPPPNEKRGGTPVVHKAA